MLFEKDDVPTAKPPLSASFGPGQGVLASQFVDRIWAEVKNLSCLPTIEQDLFFVSHDSAFLRKAVERGEYGIMPQGGQ